MNMAVRLERLQSHRLASTSQSAPTIGQHRSFGTRGVVSYNRPRSIDGNIIVIQFFTARFVALLLKGM